MIVRLHPYDASRSHFDEDYLHQQMLEMESAHLMMEGPDRSCAQTFNSSSLRPVDQTVLDSDSEDCRKQTRYCSAIVDTYASCSAFN